MSRSAPVHLAPLVVAGVLAPALGCGTSAAEVPVSVVDVTPAPSAEALPPAADEPAADARTAGRLSTGSPAATAAASPDPAAMEDGELLAALGPGVDAGVLQGGGFGSRGHGPAAPLAGTRPIAGAGFRYAVPAIWVDLAPAALGSSAIVSAQLNPVPTGPIGTHVNVAVEPFTGDGPAYAATKVLQLSRGARIRHRTTTRAGDRPANDIEIEWPNAGTVPYVTLQRYAANGTHGFVITCTVAAVVIAQERPVCMQILDSFRVE
jgi:hypothetical protein